MNEEKPEDQVVPLDDPGFLEFQERRKMPMTLADLIKQELERDRQDNA